MKYVEIGFKIFLDYFLEINLVLSIIYNGFLENQVQMVCHDILFMFKTFEQQLKNSLNMILLEPTTFLALYSFLLLFNSSLLKIRYLFVFKGQNLI